MRISGVPATPTQLLSMATKTSFAAKHTCDIGHVSWNAMNRGCSMSNTRQSPHSGLEKSIAADRQLHSNMDRRALRTRQALHEALIQLITERDYETISVIDI